MSINYHALVCCYSYSEWARSDGLVEKSVYVDIIGRFSFQIGRSGDFHYLIKNREISRQIGRLGSSVTSLRKLPYEQRLKECNLTTLEERRKRGNLLKTHKIMHGLDRIPEVTFFARGDALRRGHSLKIYKERPKREPHRNFFLQRVVIPWNALPEKVVCSNSTLQFKIEYDKFWGVIFLPRQASHRV